VALSKADALFYKALARLYHRTASAASSRSWCLLSEEDKGTRKKSLYRALAIWWPQQGVGLSKLTDEEYQAWDVLSNEEKGRWAIKRRQNTTTLSRAQLNVALLLVDLAKCAENSNTGDTAALEALGETLTRRFEVTCSPRNAEDAKKLVAVLEARLLEEKDAAKAEKDAATAAKDAAKAEKDAAKAEKDAATAAKAEKDAATAANKKAHHATLSLIGQAQAERSRRNAAIKRANNLRYQAARREAKRAAKEAQENAAQNVASKRQRTV
jgi:hypothetical protein